MQRSDDSRDERGNLSRRAFIGRAGGVGLTAMFGSVLVACGSDDGGSGGGSGGGGSKTDKFKITLPSDVTLVLWSVDYLSEDLGYYKDEGVSVERVPFGGGPLAMQGLLSGAGASTLQTPGEFLVALAKKQKLKALVSHTNAISARMVVSEKFAKRLGVGPDDSLEAKIKAIGSVKGARYAISAPGAQTDGLTRMMLKQSGLDPDADARIIPLQTGANYLPAFANGRIDGFVSGDSPVPERAILEMKGVELLSVPKGDIRGADQLAGQTLVARTSDIEANPEGFEKLVRANVRALRTLLEDPEKARDVMRKKRFPDFDEKIWDLMWRNTLPTFRSPYVNTESLGAWVKSGLVANVSDPAKLSLESAVDSRFVDKAVKAIGWTAPKA